MPPDINKSVTLFKVEDGNIRFGLGALRNVGTGLIDKIVEEREKGGVFKSFEDFVRRVSSNTLNKKSLESLILSGAFSEFGIYRSQLMDVYPLYMEMVANDRKSKAQGQFSMFDTFEEITQTVNNITLPNIREYNKDALLKYEKEYVGIYLSGHPLDDYLKKYDSFNFTSDMIADLKVDPSDMQQSDDDDEGGSYSGMTDYGDEVQESNVKDGQQVTCGGIITSSKKMNTKSGNMAILTIEDIYGTFEVMLFNKGYAKYRDIIGEDNLVTIRGKLSIREGKSPVVIAETIIPWEKKDANVVKQETKRVYLRFDTQNVDLYNKVKKISASYPGQAQVIIKCTSTNQAFSFNTKVEINNYLTNEFIGLLGEENVVIK